MKKLLLIVALFVAIQVIAQDNTQPTPENIDKAKIAQTIDALKIAYITKELNLSTDEAQKFWPLYNGLSSEIKKARLDFVQDDIAFQEKKVVIMKKYREDFKKLLNNEDRVKKCFRAEPEFHKLLRNEWIRRHPNRMPQQHLGHNPKIENNRVQALPTTPRQKPASVGGGRPRS